MRMYIEKTAYCPLQNKIVSGWVDEFWYDEGDCITEMEPIGTVVKVGPRSTRTVGEKFRGDKIFWGVFGCENGWTYEDDAEYDAEGNVVGIKKGTRIFTSMAK
jgi:hypothetical protein